MFWVDLNEVGRVGAPEQCVTVYERWTDQQPLVSASWWRKYHVGEWLRIDAEEDNVRFDAQVVAVIDNSLGHGYHVRPDWDSAVAVRIEAAS